MLTGLQVFRLDAGHICAIIRNGQSGFDEVVDESDTVVVHYHDTPIVR